MQVVVVSDRRFYRIGGRWVTVGSLGPETGHSYLNWFSHVVVIGRDGGTLTAPQAQRGQPLDPSYFTVHALPNISNILSRISTAQRIGAEISRILKSSNHLIVRLPSELGLLAASLAHSSGKQYAVDLGGCAFDSNRYRGDLKGLAYAPFAYFRNRHAVRQADWVSYVTSSFLQRRYPASPNARTLSCTNAAIDRADNGVIRDRELRISSGKRPLAFGIVGSFATAYKGVSVAVRALASIQSQLPEFELRLLGQGDPRSLIQCVPHDFPVRISEPLPSGNAVLEWLDDIDIYLHPSLTEGVPRSLLEAMSRGCPVIASAVGGIPEFLPTACLHRRGDARALSKKILAMLEDGQLMEASKLSLSTVEPFYRSSIFPRRDAFWRSFALQP